MAQEKIDIKDYLLRLGIATDSINLVDYDVIGEHCARKNREPTSETAQRKGMFFRPNYERGILIDSVMRHYDLKSYLEIGFGRGYSAICAALSFVKRGLEPDVTVVDPYLDEKYITHLCKLFPIASKFTYVKQPSHQFWFEKHGTSERWDFCYIDGDHSEHATGIDWSGAEQHTNRFVLFDDYHEPMKMDLGIKCADAIDKIDREKLYIVTDRRIFPDDLGPRTLSEMNYGQVLIDVTK